MSNIEKIRQEIERLKEENRNIRCRHNDKYCTGYDDAFNDLLAFIDSLPEENNPEPYNPIYDEDYLNEKIAKATKSWEGVDVDKMLADCRGYEEKPSEDLEEVVEAEAEVCKLIDRVWVTPTDEKKFHQDVYDNFKAGDKVKIVIVKQDE